MGDSTLGYPAPPGYTADVPTDTQTLGTPRPLQEFAGPGGYEPPAITGGQMDARPPKRDLRMNKRVVATQGTTYSDDIGFVARSVIVDNDTGQWLFDSTSRRYVPPGCFGAVLQFPSGSQVISVLWTAPPGVTQPAGIAGSQAVLIYTEDLLDPSPGVIVGGTAAAGGVSGPAVVQGTATPADATPNPTNAQADESFIMVWNGATWDRARNAADTVATKKGLLVTLQDSIGTQTAAVLGDSDANTAGANGVVTNGHAFLQNGTNWDRARSASAANLASQSGLGVQEVAPPGNWSVVSFPAANTQAAAVKAAGAAGVRHVCTGATFSITNSATAVGFQGNVQILDGATVIWQAAIGLVSTGNSSQTITVTGLSLVGSPATSMTAQFNAAGGAGTQESAVLMGYDAS